MASRKKQEKAPAQLNILRDIKHETLQGIFAIIFFLLTLITILAAFGKAGYVGEQMYIFLKMLFGVGYFLFPVVLGVFGLSFLRGMKKDFELSKIFGVLLFFFSGLGLINLHSSKPSGIVGNLISSPLLSLFDFYATIALLVSCSAIAILITFDTHFTLDDLMFWKRWFKKNELEDEEGEADEDVDVPIKGRLEDEEDMPVQGLPPEDSEDGEQAEEGSRIAQAAEEARKPKKEALAFTKEEEKAFDQAPKFTISTKPFVPPPLTLLEKDKGKPEVGDIKANANIIKRTLQNFGITVEMDEVSIGPSVTRYALKPAEGVKLAKIVGLSNDLALALAAHPIRIEAPIPGKSLVGIEIPNTTKTTVGLATLLGSDEYQSSPKPLLVSLGKGITGKSYFANVAKAPHMLIAGATGSGKSVTIHTVITSLLFRNSPENLKFIMIDPKRVELTLYNKIPHLLTPVITDPKKAILALKWAGKEMQRRYDVLEKSSVRDIESYHQNVVAPALEKMKKAQDEGEEIPPESMPETMPYMVVIIDELADIMQTYPRELEAAIVRLAQMSRAVGIHLILSTQRPSVNVITGLIKANVPTRVALQVASQIDSRTILDAAGAEKLLGAGDMLYQGGDMAKPVRLQSAFISESELKKVVQFLHEQYKDEIMGEINLTTPEAGSDAIFNASFDDGDGDGEEDDMYEAAREVVVETGKASTSFLQRKLGLGYSRAARIIDMLEERGVIGPAQGSKPREVYGSSGGGSNEEDVA